MLAENPGLEGTLKKKKRTFKQRIYLTAII